MVVEQNVVRIFKKEFEALVKSCSDFRIGFAVLFGKLSAKPN